MQLLIRVISIVAIKRRRVHPGVVVLIGFVLASHGKTLSCRPARDGINTALMRSNTSDHNTDDVLKHVELLSKAALSTASLGRAKLRIAVSWIMVWRHMFHEALRSGGVCHMM